MQIKREIMVSIGRERATPSFACSPLFACSTQMSTSEMPPSATTESWENNILTRRRIFMLMSGNLILAAPRRIIMDDDLPCRESS